MLSAAPDGTPIVQKIYTAFDEAGYAVLSDFKGALYDVADFGIPQHRKRVIILGIRKDLENDKVSCSELLSHFYAKMESHKAEQKTVEDAIGDLPKLYPLDKPVIYEGRTYSHAPFTSEGILNHIPRFHSLRDITIFRKLAEDIESGRNEFVSTEKLKTLYTEITGRNSNIHKFYVLRRDEPSNTIPAHLNKDGLRHIHPDSKQARSITVREAARLQTFPDDFEFLGSMMSQYKMIGNAVPVAFARIVAQSLKSTIDRYAALLP